jgi:hypothetical protein
VIQIAAGAADDLYIENVSWSTEENIPMLELQRSTARRMIGRIVQVACVDGQVVDGHIDWCSDEEIAVANGASRCVIKLDNVVGLVRRIA